MHRTSRAVAVCLALLAVLTVASASAETIYFYVDWELVAELESGTIPTNNRIKAAGRSYGSERSGLYDNIYVELQSGGICQDGFGTLDPGFWVTYGSPTPYVVNDFGNPGSCLCTAGDSNYDSGLASRELYDWSDGFLMRADFYMSAGIGGLEFGIADATEPGPTGMGHVIGIHWKNVHNVIHIKTDSDAADVPLPSFEEWHTIAFSTSPSHEVGVPFFSHGSDSLYVSITNPQEGSVYSPCAPDMVTWDSNIPAWQGSPDVLDLYWRECGGSWNWFADDNNDGAHPWSAAPCYTGCYQVKVVYGPDPEVSDVVMFEVEGDDPPPPPPPGDPDFMLFVDFTGDAQNVYDVESRIDPPSYTTVSAYIGIVRLRSDPDGFTVVSFRLNSPLTDCPGVVATQSFTNLLPGNLAIGDPFDATGVTLASLECMTALYTGVVYIGWASFFYLDGACDVLILDHADYPRWVVDCQDPGEVSPYCVWMHGGIAKDPVSGDQGCYPNTAVETTSWGAIKAMYR